jgi:hypothetical protein
MIDDVLLNNPDGRTKMATLFEQNAHGAIVQLLGRFKTVIQYPVHIIRKHVLS